MCLSVCCVTVVSLYLSFSAAGHKLMTVFDTYNRLFSILFSQKEKDTYNMNALDSIRSVNNHYRDTMI